MKKIILIRHAKSSWEFNVSDHDRTLTSRGIEDAHRVANNILTKINPNLIVSSDALRAKLTAEIFISNLNISHENLKLNHLLYDFTGNNLFNFIASCNSSINELMIFGHNNAITNFVNTYGDKYIDNVPTCGVTIIEFETDHWKELKKGRTIETIFPKDLKK
jgi:phosphohistidine phosphatase